MPKADGLASTHSSWVLWAQQPHPWYTAWPDPPSGQRAHTPAQLSALNKGADNKVYPSCQRDVVGFPRRLLAAALLLPSAMGLDVLSACGLPPLPTALPATSRFHELAATASSSELRRGGVR